MKRGKATRFNIRVSSICGFYYWYCYSLEIVWAWELEVELSDSSFGSERVCASVEGQYGFGPINRCTESGPGADVSFSVPEDEVPPGYSYKVCVWGGVISALISNCQMFTHGSGDESVSLRVDG
ncbi:MAG: hypothetical protein ACRD8Z_06225 [Nitrososphaeraceae archaeon]